MTNQLLLICALIICSLAGWYVVLSKYFELKTILQQREQPKSDPQQRQEPVLNTNIAAMDQAYPAVPLHADFVTNNHIPGFGPPPLSSNQFDFPAEALNAMRAFAMPPKERPPEPTATYARQTTAAVPKNTITNNSQPTMQKREVCNLASIMHLSGLAFISGVPFLNIILPAILWLWCKERHPYLLKQGREVINFQITLTIVMFLSLFLGTVFIWLFPSAADALFTWTKSIRIIFSSAMYLPFNIFTVLPFFWGCVLVIRGTVGAYHGVAFKYPFAQPFLFAIKNSDKTSDVVKPPTMTKPNFA